MNFNLFIHSELQCTELDAAHLSNCNQVARYWRHRKLFYALKNEILNTFGVRDGYDLQLWYDEHDEYQGEDYAVHKHILERFIICDQVFHKPTNEFYYSQFDWPNITKSSPNFSELSELTKNTIVGKKPFIFKRKEDQMAFWSLKRLVRKFGYLLRQERKAA